MHQVAGVQIDGNGFSWLQILATNEKVKFLPINNTGTECQAKVYLIHPNRKDLDIGRALVGLGFAKAAPMPTEIPAGLDKSILHYHAQLVSSEKKAKSLRKGMWHLLPEPWLRLYIRTSYDKILFSLKRGEMKLPALVRSS